jgi:hypothetical protein
MKTIKPVSIWDKGTTHQAEILNAYGTFTQLGKSAQFYYQLFAKNETSMVQVAEGNLTMIEEDYQKWGDDDNYVWDFVGQKLNLEIIGDWVAPEIPSPEQSQEDDHAQ